MRFLITAILIILVIGSCVSLSGCEIPTTANAGPTGSSGVRQATVKVQTDASGLTIEQNNVISRLKMDNNPGSIKHLYIISAYSGDVLLYSTVKGKVTSSGKRLTPTTVTSSDGELVNSDMLGISVVINNEWHRTEEVLQDDGTYGSSIEYLYWWDQRGVYHQQYVSGGFLVHVSDQPVRVGKVLINIEEQGTNAQK